MELYDLPGIPAEVKARLTNFGNGYNPVEAIRWAKANADNEELNRFNNNCALFVSESLLRGGLPEREGQWAKRDWLDPIPDVPALPSWVPGLHDKDADSLRYTKSWFNADEQRLFLLNTGGAAVPESAARPGDVAYFNYADCAIHHGEVSHHAAIVSAVLPNGDVLYTQHTPGAVDYSLQDRIPMRLQEQGNQTVTIVRPQGASQ